MNWTVILIIAGWVIPAIAAAILTRAFERRPRLISYLRGSGAVALNYAQPPLLIHMHTVVLRNVGGKAARNVAVSHSTLPPYSIYPPLQHNVATLPGGAQQILFPSFPPKTEIAINYAYFPPLTWNKIHLGINSDDGQPKVIEFLPTPRPSKIVVWVSGLLMTVGLIALIYLLYVLALHLAEAYST